jgi:hypothetical protein
MQFLALWKRQHNIRDNAMQSLLAGLDAFLLPRDHNLPPSLYRFDRLFDDVLAQSLDKDTLKVLDVCGNVRYAYIYHSYPAKDDDTCPLCRTTRSGCVSLENLVASLGYNRATKHSVVPVYFGDVYLVIYIFGYIYSSGSGLPHKAVCTALGSI